MSFKYYDILSNLVCGFVLLYILSYEYGIISTDVNALILTALAYITGYLLNAVSALLQPIYFFTMGGMPSAKLLTVKDGIDHTGYGRIKFYRSDAVIKKARAELKDPSACIEKVSHYAMSVVNNKENTRVPDFNAKFAFSRVVLTLIICVNALFLVKFYGLWYAWIIAVTILLISWNRCKENGYYYAREVLNEYLKTN